MGNGSVPVDHGDEARRVLRLARLHRWLQRMFLVELIVMSVFAVFIAAPVRGEDTLILVVLGLGVVTAIVIFILACIALPVARAGPFHYFAMGVTPVVVALGTISMGDFVSGLILVWILFPIASMLVTHRMFKRVRAMGVRVPELGAQEEDIAKARLGICLACGYEVRGLPTDVCPECGKESGIGAKP